ncbi:MAG: circadian clock protein KaiB [Phycisphaerae bacterium]|nr:circadian clock protein KaiB [Phycisphaerae bacterium]
MSKPVESTNAPVATTAGKKYVLRLFVAGDEPNSKKARENLTQLCETHLQGEYEVEIVDVLEDFEAALKSNVLLTPALIVVAPKPTTIFGNLNDTDKVLGALRLSGGKS